MLLVELKNIELPGSMQRATARQAEAERERRAKIIAAEGEALFPAQFMESVKALQRFTEQEAPAKALHRIVRGLRTAGIHVTRVDTIELQTRRPSSGPERRSTG